MNFTFNLRAVRSLEDDIRSGLIDDYGFTRNEAEELLDAATIRIARVGLPTYDPRAPVGARPKRITVRGPGWDRHGLF